MTYDPYRNATRPDDPYQSYNRDMEGGSGAAIALGALVLLALGGFIYFFGASSDSGNVATDMRPPITQPSTTGSGGGTPEPSKPAQ